MRYTPLAKGAPDGGQPPGNLVRFDSSHKRCTPGGNKGTVGFATWTLGFQTRQLRDPRSQRGASMLKGTAVQTPRSRQGIPPEPIFAARGFQRLAGVAEVVLPEY